MAGDPKYITRLMRIRCSKGTMDNYINVGTDHGVLAGADQQPVLNANDHTKENLIHCGNCESDANPERMLKKKLVASLMGPAGLVAGDMLTAAMEKLGIMPCKCKPNTPLPWIFTNENNILEGAPALTMDSKIACRYGGVIEFVPLNEYPADEQETTPEPERKEEIPEPDIVETEVAEAVRAAREEVAETEEGGENGRSRV